MTACLRLQCRASCVPRSSRSLSRCAATGYGRYSREVVLCRCWLVFPRDVSLWGAIDMGTREVHSGEVTLREESLWADLLSHAGISPGSLSNCRRDFEVT